MGKLAGTSAIARIAGNLQCELQVAIALSDLSEPKFFEAVTGTPYMKEYGERESARRRGRKFEDNAYRYDAQALKEALAGFIGLPISDIVVRNLEDDVPGATENTRIQRFKITRTILRDLQAGKAVPHILIQPQLILYTGESLKKRIFVAPDLLVLDAQRRMYEPGDLKSFVVRENDVPASDLERVRLQIAAAVLALRSEMQIHGGAALVTNHGLMIFSTAFGLKPHPYRREAIDGAVHTVKCALEFLRTTSLKIEAIAKPDDPPLPLLAPELKAHYQERCVSSCTLAEHCRARHVGTAQELGDSAAEVFGAGTALDRLVELLRGVTPGSDMERDLAERLRQAAARLGIQEVA